MMAQIMNILIFLIIALKIAEADKCEKIKIDNDHYKRHLIATIDGFPTGLVVDPVTENLYFRLHKRNYTKGIYVLKFGSLGIKEIRIADDFIGQCVGIDAATNNMYIGTNQGLLLYNGHSSEVSSERPIGDDDIRNIFFDKTDNQMYITVGANQEIFKFINGSAAVKRFDKIQKAYNFVMDSRGNVFYEFVDGRLYFLSSDLYEPIQYKGFNRELKYILQLNSKSEAIIAVKGSLFKLDTRNIIPLKIGSLGFKITGLTFDRNSMVIGTKGKIYKYKPVDSNDPCPPDDYFMSGMM